MSEHEKIKVKPKKDSFSSFNLSDKAHSTKDQHPSAVVQQAWNNINSLTHADVIQLQKTLGNKAVCQLIKETGSGVGISNPVPGKSFAENNMPQKQKVNRTGLPDNLKSGVEKLSGFSMNDVRVHYNSNKPAVLGALAYTQGKDIHLAPGQEKHLPHETWHVVQQAQGRVKPTMQYKEIAVNDNAGLEAEASMMGKKALNIFHEPSSVNSVELNVHASTAETMPTSTVHQFMFPRKAKEKNPYSIAPPKYGISSQHSMGLRFTRPIEEQQPVYTGSLLWSGFRTGAYPTSFSKETIDAVYNGQINQTCNKCGSPCAKGIDAQIDHIVPFYQYIDNYADRSGQEVINGVTWYGYLKDDIADLYNDISNLQILCKSCNASKGGQSSSTGYQPTTNPTE